MADLPDLPPGVLDFIGRYRPPTRGMVPARLRLAPDLHHRLIATPGWPAYGGPLLFGLTVTVDQHLPAGVWRVLADDDTLLRDSRSTNEVT